MTSPRSFTEQNRRAWNQIAGVREAAHLRTGTFKPAAFYRDGGFELDPRVVEAAGDVLGKNLLHLQCATGRESLSWANLGARVTGVDIADEAIAIARANGAEAGLDVRFVAADVYALPPDLAGFDLVYTAGGILCWLPDIWEWGRVVARALAPGGRAVIFEEHPIAECLRIEDGAVVFPDDYFSRARPYDEGPGWAFFDDGGASTERKYEFGWPLGDVLTALARAGLRIETLEEFPADPSGYRFEGASDDVRKIPGDFLLVARKEEPPPLG